MNGITRIILGAALLLLVPALAFSANGDTLNIGGQVPLVLNLTVTPDADADNLTLLGSTTPTVDIALIDVSTNNTAGWELHLFSANATGTGTFLENADGDQITYTVTFNSTGGATTADVLDTGLLLKDDGANGEEIDTPLQITYTQEPDLAAGYYSDQLSIVLRAK